jgi:cytochrome c553
MMLEVAMHRSVATHSLFVGTPPKLDDLERIRLGAGHFHSGCALCHGAPGESRNPIFNRMLPPPPSLSRVAADWSDKELFWIVKNGIKYTGMPAWVAQKRDDEVWAVVAFLRFLPTLTNAEYQKVTRSDLSVTNRNLGQTIRFGSERRAISACTRCHESVSTPPISVLVPALAGQSSAYLENAIRQYADGRRQSGIMQPAVAQLNDEAIAHLVRYYATLTPNPVEASAASERQILQGQKIATGGIPDKGVPACLACHAGSAATFPKLAGQHARYMANQLHLWQQGLRAGTAHGAIMAPIAKRLTGEQIENVAAYFASVGPAAKAEPRIGERTVQ